MPKAEQAPTQISGSSGLGHALRRALACAGGKWRHGYSLIEVVVALAIAALSVSLATPSILRMIDGWQDRSVVRELIRDMGNLRAEAALARTGQAGTAIQAELSASLPSGWQLHVSDGFEIRPAGLCTAGQLQLVSPRGRVVALQNTQPSCQLALVNP